MIGWGTMSGRYPAFANDNERTSSTGKAAQTLTLSDRPELRIDPTAIVSTGALANVSGARSIALKRQGPTDRSSSGIVHVERGVVPGLTSLNFDGGYAQASYVLTGETHTYNSAVAAYNGIVPANPLSLTSGGWGAWEIAGRISMINLNDQLATANGVVGGKRTIYSAGLNWYINRNVRFMFNCLHGDIAKQVSATDPGNVGAKFDAICDANPGRLLNVNLITG